MLEAATPTPGERPSRAAKETSPGVAVVSTAGAWFSGIPGARFSSDGYGATWNTSRPTTVDPEVARLQAPHEGTPFELAIERVNSPRHLAFRWHPFAVEPGADYSREPTTLVEFDLEEIAGGTRLRIVESGFDRIPAERRAAAFAANEGGWEHQARLVARYVSGASSRDR